EKILLFLRESRELGLTADQLGIRLGLFGKHLKKALQDPISTKKMVVVDSATQRYVIVDIAENIKTLLLEKLGEYHKNNPLLLGLAKDELRTGLERKIDSKVYNYCINELMRKGDVVQEDSLIRLAGHEIALKADEEQLQKELFEWYRQKGLSTPTIKETMERFSDYPSRLVKEVIDIQIREGNLLKISESLYYSKEILDPLVESVIQHIEKNGEIDAPNFKELTGLTRKFSIPILEYLDRVKITMRIGDKRILRKKAN
ncbi:MAG: selenocysteine-specific translation factor, partial [Bacteroidetes bacterium]|nr:selenocysteine-specific translation factor [Bacteroidota bacterium]